MESLKNVYCEKMGLFRFLAEKFFLWRRARSRGVGVRGVLARRGVGVRGVLARRFGRVWMDAMEVVHV